jgi:hypothetical protein
MSDTLAEQRLDLRGTLAGLLRAAGISGFEVSPLGGGAGGGSLFRVRAASGGADARSLVWKRTSAHERAVHALLDRELPGVAAPLVASGAEPGDGASAGAWILMLDVGGGASDPAGAGGLRWSAATAAADRDLRRRGLGKLARVHGRFLGQTGILRDFGLSFEAPAWCEDGSEAAAIAGALRLCSDLLGLWIPPRTLDEIDAICRRLPEHLAPLRAPRRLTLVHGDFHQGNVAAGPDGDVRILDWGEAVIQSPAWDLVMFEEPEIRSYLGALPPDAALDTGAFRAELRAAVICRMLQFLRAALRALFGGAGQGDGEGLSRSLGICASRLVEAAGWLSDGAEESHEP